MPLEHAERKLLHDLTNHVIGLLERDLVTMETLEERMAEMATQADIDAITDHLKTIDQELVSAKPEASMDITGLKAAADSLDATAKTIGGTSPGTPTPTPPALTAPTPGVSTPATAPPPATPTPSPGVPVTPGTAPTPGVAPVVPAPATGPLAAVPPPPAAV